ncbi:hypothetical protein LFYK43_23370 [Ligilactobacillus salitolerans]|uniref:Uncharacterized protein n=1 Tax=Ligilactobacillus salitolerans TaxID=1808352 RepID=A0A401IWJ6_9LACO|nr:hypothetical protein [Ligilactobacillus salitolerans]GBG95878.1 hypothetical protein LFYK43_23370 [Ligilactobacillus salitolerans]
MEQSMLKYVPSGMVLEQSMPKYVPSGIVLAQSFPKLVPKQPISTSEQQAVN